MKESVRYLKYILGVVFFVLLSIGTFNWFIDPFEIYWTGEYKPHRKIFMKKVWIFKAMNVRKITPQSLILGSSRSMIGLEAEHPGGDPSVSPRYNFGVPASNLYEILSFLEHSNELNPIKQAIVGIDFYAFNIFYQGNTEFNDSFLLKEGDSQLLSHFRETMISLFTLTSFDLSKKKMRSRGEEMFYLNGSLASFYKLPKETTPGKLFPYNQNYYLEFMLYPPPIHHFCLYDKNGENPQMRALEKLVNLANRKSIDLRIFIHPIHASLQQIIKYAGLWNEFEDWKKNSTDNV